MKYKSTRGGSEGSTFEDALFSGYAPDGGLFVPEEIPKISKEALAEWKRNKLTYRQVVEKVSRLFIDTEEIPDDVLTKCVNEAYDKFKIPQTIEVAECKGTNGDVKVKVAELYHGPTASFKDLALCLVNRLLSYFMEKRKDHCTILVGTSGDTGSAAIESVKGLKNVDIIVLYPKGMVSPIQEMQMTCDLDKAKNVHVYAVEGTSDDLDIPIRDSLPAPGLTSVNSINFARIMVQVAHYIYLYLLEDETLNEDSPINIIVPTGAAGNIVSGILAIKMGVPLNLYSATNENDSVNLFLAKGEVRFGGQIKATPANAMDIQFPYNIERILYFFFGSSRVVDFFPEAKGQLELFEVEEMRKMIRSSTQVPTEAIYSAIKRTWDDFHYIICPHTATAMHLFYSDVNLHAPHEPCYILSTASPQKFPESVEKAGISPTLWKSSELYDELKKRSSGSGVGPKVMKKGENWHAILQKEIRETKEKFFTQF